MSFRAELQAGYCLANCEDWNAERGFCGHGDEVVCEGVDEYLDTLLPVIDKYCWLKDERELPNWFNDMELEDLRNKDFARGWIAATMAGYKPGKPVIERVSED